jgi:hypothetical protein
MEDGKVDLFSPRIKSVNRRLDHRADTHQGMMPNNRHRPPKKAGPTSMVQGASERQCQMVGRFPKKGPSNKKPATAVIKALANKAIVVAKNGYISSATPPRT